MYAGLSIKRGLKNSINKVDLNALSGIRLGKEHSQRRIETMARYTLKGYEIGITTSEDDYERVWVSIKTENKSGNEKKWERTLCPDTRYKDAQTIEKLIREGLEKAYKTGQQIGISEQKERNYIFIELPDPSETDSSTKKVNHQLSVKCT